MTYEEFARVLESRFPQSLLTDETMGRFKALEALYTDWNSKINVISRKDMDSFYERHVLHSLCIAEYMLEKGWEIEGRSFLDVGTGGGFPGIPLAILFPQCSFTLCDSIGKKIKVASSVAEALALENVTTVVSRVEALPEKQSWDYVVSRAVTALDGFLPLVAGRWKSGMLYLKGGSIEPGGALDTEIRNARGKKGFPTGSAMDLWPLADFEQKYVLSFKK